MEQRVINLNRKDVIHKNNNRINNINLNKTRIKIMGKGYLIDNKRLELYRNIGDIISMIGMFIGIYFIYCCIWLYQ